MNDLTWLFLEYLPPVKAHELIEKMLIRNPHGKLRDLIRQAEKELSEEKDDFQRRGYKEFPLPDDAFKPNS
jgi:hypothetical protein